MCSSHRPENGADSEDGYVPEEEEHTTAWDAAQRAEGDPRPPLVEFPHPNANMVRAYLKDAGTPPEQIEVETNKAIMADALGRAIHAAKRTGGPWGSACVRPKWSSAHIEAAQRGERLTEADFEQVPYNYDGGEFECECEAMALHLVSLMTEQKEANARTAAQQIVLPRGHGRSN